MLLEKDRAYIETLMGSLAPEDINEINNIITRRKNDYFMDAVNRLESLKAEARRISDEMSGIKTELETEARRLKLAGNIKESREYYDIINDAEIGNVLNKPIEFTYDNPFLKDLCIGDTVSLGKYPQGIDAGVQAPILWKVLDAQGGKALLLSKYCLECQPFNIERNATDWVNSSLSKWLNNEFAKSFSSEEHSLLIPDSNDLVTILGIDELDMYLQSEKSRSCYGTVHALKTANHFIDSTAVSYWIKGDIVNPVHAGVVTPLGSICKSKAVDDMTIGIRPAVWVRFK